MPTEHHLLNSEVLDTHQILPLGALCPHCNKVLVGHTSPYGIVLFHLSGDCENVATLGDHLELFDVGIQIHQQAGGSQ